MNYEKYKQLKEALDYSSQQEKVFKYDGTNQNTLHAWIRVDTPKKENVEIEVKDNFGSYSWYRQKSNDNVRGEVKDGKGFSFFFARYAYLDDYLYEDESFATGNDLNRSAFLAAIPFKSISNFKSIKNDKSIAKKLDPPNTVMLVINIDNTRIISATYTGKDEYFLPYIENRARKMLESQSFSKGQQRLKEKLNLSIEEKLYKMLTEGYKQFGEFLIAAKNKE
jgi:hypothetical protein